MSNDRCILVNTESGNEVPLKSVEVTGNINGLTCQWEMIQKFVNTEDKAIEAVFSFPLPSDATLSRLKILTGKRTIVATPEEREKAFEQYDEAIAQGDGAFLLDQERPNFFVMSLGNVLPGQGVEIHISMFQLLQAQSHQARVSFPVAVVPRYSPDQGSSEAIEWDRVEPEFTDAAPYGFNLTLNIRQNSAIRVVESPSHPIKVANEKNSAVVSLSQTTTMPDSDVIISFELVEDFKPLLSCNRLNQQDHILFEVFPQFSDTGDSQKTKEITFIVDCSGSMSGDSIQEAKNALQLCIRSLNEADIFQIICFGSNWQQLFDVPLVFNQESLEIASKKIAAIDSDMGGTEILPALNSAIKALKLEFSSIILFTDGAVSNEKDVIKLAESSRNRCRIFSFGIGNGASEYLVKGIAEKSGGKAEFIHPGERIEPKVLRQFNRLNAPRLSNLRMNWNCDHLEMAPEKLGPVFSGDVIRFAARLKDGKKIPTDLKVKLEATLEDQELAWESKAVSRVKTTVPALWWAKQRILDLENTSNEEKNGSKQREKSASKTVSPTIAISKAYGILCSQTSYIGIEERKADEKNDGNVELKKIPAMKPAKRGFMARGKFSAYANFALAGAVASCCPPPSPAPHKSRVRGKKPPAEVCESKLFSRFEDSVKFFAEPSPLEDNFSQVFDSENKKDYSSHSEEDILMKILMLVKADGSFDYSEKLLELLNISNDDFAPWLSKAPKNLSEKERQAYAITLLVKDKLETVFNEQKEIWSAIAGKIKRWLKKFPTN